MASYKIKSTLSCPDEIKVKLKDNVVKLIEFNGGCSVINQAITKLSANRDIDELIELLSDINELILEISIRKLSSGFGSS